MNIDKGGVVLSKSPSHSGFQGFMYQSRQSSHTDMATAPTDCMGLLDGRVLQSTFDESNLIAEAPGHEHIHVGWIAPPVPGALIPAAIQPHPSILGPGDRRIYVCLRHGLLRFYTVMLQALTNVYLATLDYPQFQAMKEVKDMFDLLLRLILEYRHIFRTAFPQHSTMLACKIGIFAVDPDDHDLRERALTDTRRVTRLIKHKVKAIINVLRDGSSRSVVQQLDPVTRVPIGITRGSEDTVATTACRKICHDLAEDITNAYRLSYEDEGGVRDGIARIAVSIANAAV